MSGADDDEIAPRDPAGAPADDDPRPASEKDGPPERIGSPTALFVVAVGVIAGVGFLAGTRARAKPAGYQIDRATPESAMRAPTYADLRSRRWGVNAGLYDDQVKGLALSAPAPTPGAVEPASATERLAALHARAERRAYAGAPPVIPHAVDQRGLPSCLACHASGAVAAGRLAPTMSHPPFRNCVQCHVPGIVPEPLTETAATENSFVGAIALGDGSRAWLGAPPTMPHPSFMRERCPSCHGVAARPGLQSPHLERSACQQCHAPSAVLDQRDDPSATTRGPVPVEAAL